MLAIFLGGINGLKSQYAGGFRGSECLVISGMPDASADVGRIPFSEAFMYRRLAQLFKGRVNDRIMLWLLV